MQSLREHGDTVRLVALPMRPERELLGVLAIHHDRDESSLDVETAQFLANATGVALVGQFHRPEDDLWASRDSVSQATGMVRDVAGSWCAANSGAVVEVDTTRRADLVLGAQPTASRNVSSRSSRPLG